MALSAAWQHITTDKALQRSSHMVSVVGGDAYIFGGELLPRQPIDNQIYRIHLQNRDQDVSRISSTSRAPPPRVGATSTTLGNKVYIWSGRGGEAMSPIEEEGAFWVFDTVHSSWSFLTPASPGDPFPEPRSYHCSTTDDNESIFIHAGCPASGRLSDLWSFNTKTRIWTRHADAPAPARGGSSIAFFKGRLYRMNGFDGKKEQGGVLDVYNLESNTWDFRPFSADGEAGPAPRSVSVLLPISVSGKHMLVTLFGEGDPSALGHAGAGKMFEDVWAYDIENDKWSKVDIKWDYDRRPPARGWFDADIVNDSTIVLVGGLAESNERLQDCWQLRF